MPANLDVAVGQQRTIDKPEIWRFAAIGDQRNERSIVTVALHGNFGALAWKQNSQPVLLLRAGDIRKTIQALGDGVGRKPAVRRRRSRHIFFRHGKQVEGPVQDRRGGRDTHGARIWRRIGSTDPDADGMIAIEAYRPSVAIS